MKYFLAITLTVLCLNASKVLAQTPIMVTSTDIQYQAWDEIILNYASTHERNLSDLLGKELECRLVKLKTNVLKEPRLFKRGLYNLSLSAICNIPFKNLSMDVTYSSDLGEPYMITISYKATNGKTRQLVSKTNQLD